MKIYFLISIFLFISTGCTTVEFIRKDTSPRKTALVRYALASSPEREKEYREVLDKEAKEFCGGDYYITKEYQAREESSSSAGVGTGFGIGRGTSIFMGGYNRPTSLYNFAEFDCRP